MTSGILLTLGGVGLFLLGMVTMTDGLRKLAGGLLRRLLTRFTRSPVSGAVTGALTTALVQSSSATTVAAVGFAGAGLLPFAQAVGVIFGANIGSTITGWVAALLGFKLKLGQALMPLLLVGAVLRLFGSGRARSIGMALAGFGLVFVGIETLQAGMAGLEGLISPDRLPPDTLGGRLLLVGFGMLMTIVTQSSGAGVVAALAALDAGAIALPQAMAMVIGMDVGTTATAALATVGGSTEARRTGLAHVVYNLLTGAFAFALLTPWAFMLRALAGGGEVADPEIALVTFHTTFNVLAVLVALPFARPFARLIERLFPEREPAFMPRLDAALLRDPAVAVDAIGAAAERIVALLFPWLRAALSREPTPRDAPDPQALLPAAHELQKFAAQLTTERGPEHRRHLALAHARDHLERMIERCLKRDRIATVVEDGELAALAAPLARALGGDPPGDPAALSRCAQRLESLQEDYRGRTLDRGAHATTAEPDTLARLDAFRWLRRMAQHAFRITHHLRVETEVEDGLQIDSDLE
jgi:phosphate:Na+ symporter